MSDRENKQISQVPTWALAVGAVLGFAGPVAAAFAVPMPEQHFMAGTVVFTIAGIVFIALLRQRLEGFVRI